MSAALTLIPGGLTDAQAMLRDAHKRIAEKAPTHPVLRWTPHWTPDDRAQHRLARGHRGKSACGILATFTLAAADDPPCRACFPKAQ